MRRGDHAADGSFKNAAMVHTGRGAVLVVIAFLIGVGLLHSADSSQSIGVSETATPTTAKPPKSTTTSAVPATTTTTLPTHDPKTVKVLAANGSNTDGIGNKTRLKLQSAGYDALAPVTATAKTPTTIVYWTPGYQGDAVAVAALFGFPASAAQPMPAKPPVPSLGTANIVVFAGDDIVAVLNAPAAGTTTTAKPATSATTVRSATATTAAPTTTAKPAATTTTKKP